MKDSPSSIGHLRGYIASIGLRSASPMLLLAIVSCAFGVAPTPAPSITSADSSASLPGTWTVAITQELELPTRMLLHVSKNADGSLLGAFDDLSDPEQDGPQHGISVSGQTVSMEIQGGVVQGTLNAEGNEIIGTIKPTGLFSKLLIKATGNRSEFPLVMHRIDDADLPPRLSSRYYSLNNHRIHYVEVTGSSAARIVFIHGSPGDAADWNPYLTDPNLRRHATLVAVDRPGFGQSDPGNVVVDLREQARLLDPVLHPAPALVSSREPDITTTQSNPQAPTIVVGWSEGGTLAAELAMDFPADVQAALLEAPAIDPAHDGARWYNHVAGFWPIGKLVSGLMGDSMLWSNQEILALEPQLKAMEPRWKSVAVPVVVIQGDADGLVDPRTADFAERVLPSTGSVIRVHGADHGVPFTNKALAALNATLDRLTASTVHTASSGS